MRREPQRLPQAIEEVVRYRTPAQMAFRETRREVELHGQRVPPGKLLLPVVGSANRDPTAFHDPDRFDISREPNAHVGFGHGIHFCIGAALARIEGRVAAADLLARWRTFERASDEPWEPRLALHAHGPRRLPLRFEVH